VKRARETSSRPSSSQANQPGPARHPSLDFWICVLLLLAILAVYGQVRSHGFVNYDDPQYVTGNPQVRGGLTWHGLVWAFTSAHDSNWIPLTWLSHMLDCELFGLESAPHHLMNVALHAVAALLLFGLLRRMTGARWRSAFVALAFALHPLHVESVAWVAERKDVLSAALFFLTLWAYLDYTERPSRGRYLLVVLIFCCGLMAKPMVITLPFIALLLDFWPLRRKAAVGLILERLPLFVLAAGASVVTYLVQEHAGAVSSVSQVPFVVRLQNALVSYVAYLGDFVWPVRLAVFYPYSIPPVGEWMIAGFALAAVTVLVLRARDRYPYAAVGWLWYLGTLVPVIGLVQAGSQCRADRYTYIPMVGISIVLAWGAAEAVRRWRWGRPALAVSMAAVCSAWSVVAWFNVGNWRNSISLFRHAIEVTNENYVAYNNLAVAQRQAGEFNEAVSSFQSVVRIQPQDAQARDNLGEALMAVGRADEAMPHLEEAVRLQPGFAKAHIDLASALIRSGRPAQAEAQYRVALQLRPVSAEAHYGLGGVLVERGRLQEALPHLQEALPQLVEAVGSNPGDPDLRYNLGTLLGMMGRADEAIAQFAEAVRLQPGNPEAHFNLGTALAARNRLEEARDEFAAAVRLRPDYVNAHINLGRILAALGHADEAAREFSEAERLKPGFAAALK
jgi:tetratricopeptide (TPR) repeat protein